MGRDALERLLELRVSHNIVVRIGYDHRFRSADLAADLTAGSSVMLVPGTYDGEHRHAIGGARRTPIAVRGQNEYVRVGLGVVFFFSVTP
jgi:hypothetical protein